MKRILIVLSLVLALFMVSGCIARPVEGVIGGADGPTAIFVTGPQPHRGTFVLIAAGCAGAITAGVLLLWKARKRH